LVPLRGCHHAVDVVGHDVDLRVVAALWEPGERQQIDARVTQRLEDPRRFPRLVHHHDIRVAHLANGAWHLLWLPDRANQRNGVPAVSRTDLGTNKDPQWRPTTPRTSVIAIVRRFLPARAPHPCADSF